MPLSFETDQAILGRAEIEEIWRLAREKCGIAEQEVAIKNVSEAEIKQLNRQYRHKNEATNVLTFSYGDGSHDIALCLTKIKMEAEENSYDLKAYLAWVIVHAFLHAAGLDHERSETEADRMRMAEQEILNQAGYALKAVKK